MIGRKIWIAAGIIYVAVLACALFPSSSPAVEAKIPDLVSIKGLKPYISITLRLQRVDWVEEYKKMIDKIADEGADSVLFVVDMRQDNSSSSKMYVDMRVTMTPPQLTEIIGHAKSKNLRVILMPIVLLDDDTDPNWRGKLFPKKMDKDGHEVDGWDRWFDSYRDAICHFARIARDTNVDVFSVGSELVNSQDHKQQWIDTITAVRAIYKGQLTYSSNWDRYSQVPFWEYLDLVCMNTYWDMTKNPKETGVDTFKATWSGIQKDLFAFLHKVNKPVMFSEVGWCSLANAATASWDYTQTQNPADNDLQKRLYEAFFESWWDKPELAGFSVWEFDPGGDPTGKGYTPVGKPAEKVMQDWFAKPRWEVQASQ